MFTSTPEKKPDPKKMFPQFFPKAQYKAKFFAKNALKINWTENPFSFASFANAAQMEQFAPFLIPIDISEEMALLNATSDSSLEVTLPILGLLDITAAKQNLDFLQQMPTVMAINSADGKDPYPEFILATDLIGNRYEIIINSQGDLEFPKEGTGLFTLLSSITFIYSAQQIQQGAHGKLYLLPPLESVEPFKIHLNVSHINQSLHKEVNSVKTIEIEFAKEIHSHIDANAQSKLIDNHGHCDIEVHLNAWPKGPFSLYVQLSSIPEAVFELNRSRADLNQHWLEHPIHENVFIKHYGLQEKTFRKIIQLMYTQVDVLKDILNGDKFGIYYQQGYNEFLLRPLALSLFYRRLVKDLMHHRLPGHFLFIRLSPNRFINLNLSDISCDLHDSVVFAQIQTECKEDHFESLYDLFLTPHHSNRCERLGVKAENIEAKTPPKVTIQFISQAQTLKTAQMDGKDEIQQFHTPNQENSATPKHKG